MSIGPTHHPRKTDCFLALTERIPIHVGQSDQPITSFDHIFDFLSNIQSNVMVFGPMGIHLSGLAGTVATGVT